MDRFVDIKGYEGLYQITNTGNIKSVKRGHLLKNRIGKTGYYSVMLYKNGKPKAKRVHRAVWEAFIGIIPDGFEIDHIDGDKTNNSIDNLRCVTHKDNINNPNTIINLGKGNIGKKRTEQTKTKISESHYKKIAQYTKDFVFIRYWDSPVVVQNEMGYHKGNICLCAKGIRPTANGYIWRYA